MTSPPPYSQSKLGHYAGFFSRSIAFAIDTVIVSIAFMFAAWFLSATVEALQTGPLFDFLTRGLPGLKRIAGFLISPGATGLYAFISILLYHVFFLSFAGQTPGKAVMGIRVIPLRGGKMSLWRGTIRFIGYYISGFFIGLGFFWILIDDRRLAWHDKIARTCVVYAWDARPDESFLVYATQQLVARRDALRSILTRSKSFDHIVIEKKTDTIDQENSNA